jgi:hypothetical protein
LILIFTGKKCYLIISCKKFILFHDVIYKYLLFNLVHFQYGPVYILANFLNKQAMFLNRYGFKNIIFWNIYPFFKSLKIFKEHHGVRIFIFALVFNFRPFLEQLPNLHKANYTEFFRDMFNYCIEKGLVYIAHFRTILFKDPDLMNNDRYKILQETWIYLLY